MFGHHDIFCGYFNVFPDVTKIDGDFNEATNDNEAQGYARMPGVIAWVERVPYDPAVDGALAPADQVLLQQDLLWEGKRGSQEWRDSSADHFQKKRRGTQPVIPPMSKGHRKLLQ